MPKKKRKALVNATDRRLVEYLHHGGDLTNYRVLGQLTGLTPEKIQARLKKLGLKESKSNETNAQGDLLP